MTRRMLVGGTGKTYTAVAPLKPESGNRWISGLHRSLVFDNHERGGDFCRVATMNRFFSREHLPAAVFSATLLAVHAAFPVPTRGGQSTEFSDGKAAASQLGQVDLLTAGGNNRGGVASAVTLNDPVAVAVDPTTGKVFVADRENNRVLRYGAVSALANGAAAEAVLGQANFTTTAGTVSRSRFLDPRSVCCDEEGRLWVLDGNRVLRFDSASTLANGANANGVLGQANFTSTAANPGQNGLGDPAGIFVSVAGALWVSSPGLNRVTRFANAAAKADGANADTVLGQIDFVETTAATTRSGLSAPSGLAVDLAGNLYVADTGNNRVLVFKDADTGANGRAADIVLGQLVDTSDDAGLGAFGMTAPVGVTVSTLGTLFVSDRGNERVLLFKNAANKGDGGAAEGVLGQGDLGAPVPGTLDRSFNNVAGLWADGENRLWAADSGLARVVRFETDRFQPDARIGSKATSLKGDGIYNQTASGQKVRINFSGSKKARAFLAIENDGDTTDEIGFTGPAGNRFIRLTYLQGAGTNVTAQVIAGTHRIEDLAAGQGVSLQVQARGERKFRERAARFKAKFYVRSITDGETDRVDCTFGKRP